MDCARFDQRLDALLDGSCTPDEWRGAEAHAAHCARCRGLLEALSGLGARQERADEEQFAAAVLARTSGATCAAARERLCDLVDGTLDRFDRELVEDHVTRCRPCAELASALARATAVLPGFSDLPVPAGLETSVIAATSRRPSPPSFDERVAAWLERLSARPRISLEVAYVCTLLIVVLIGNPVAAFRETSMRGRELAQPKVERVVDRLVAVPTQLARDLRAAVGERTSRRGVEAAVGSEVSSLLASAWGWVRTHVVGTVRAAAERLFEWVSAVVRPNPGGAGRVSQAEGSAGGQPTRQGH